MENTVEIKLTLPLEEVQNLADLAGGEEHIAGYLTMLIRNLRAEQHASVGDLRLEQLAHEADLLIKQHQQYKEAIKSLNQQLEERSLARTELQTVLSVLCAYLRRPFEHAAITEKPEDPDQAFFGEKRAVSPEEDREMTVRMTAQRLITDMLPWGEDPDDAPYQLDLTGAKLVHFRLEGRRFGRLVARVAGHTCEQRIGRDVERLGDRGPLGGRGGSRRHTCVSPQSSNPAW